MDKLQRRRFALLLAATTLIVFPGFWAYKTFVDRDEFRLFVHPRGDRSAAEERGAFRSLAECRAEGAQIAATAAGSGGRDYSCGLGCADGSAGVVDCRRVFGP